MYYGHLNLVGLLSHIIIYFIVYLAYWIHWAIRKINLKYETMNYFCALSQLYRQKNYEENERKSLRKYKNDVHFKTRMKQKKLHQIPRFISRFTQTATWNVYIKYTNLYIIFNSVFAGSFHLGVKNRFYLQVSDSS